MYRFDESGWPVVSIVFENGTTVEESQRFLADLQALAARDAPFGVVLTTDGKSPLTPMERKRFAAWFKAQKPLLRKRCVGLVRLSEDATFLQRLSLKALNATMPFAVSIATTRSEATRWLQQKLTI